MVKKQLGSMVSCTECLTCAQLLTLREFGLVVRPLSASGSLLSLFILLALVVSFLEQGGSLCPRALPYCGRALIFSGPPWVLAPCEENSNNDESVLKCLLTRVQLKFHLCQRKMLQGI